MHGCDGCTANDAVPILLQACINLSMWLRQTKWIILCLVHVLTVGTSGSTLTRKSFKATCFGEVSCPAIIVGPSTEKEGLGWKTMKKRRMMTTILCSLKNTVIL